MNQSLDSSKEYGNNLMEEIEKAIIELKLSEKAFQWAYNDNDAVDLAILRKQVAVQNFEFLIKQAKKAGIKLDRKKLIEKILKSV